MVNAILEPNGEVSTQQVSGAMSSTILVADRDATPQSTVLLAQAAASKTLAEAQEALVANGRDAYEKATTKENSHQDPRAAYQASVDIKIASSTPEEIRLTAAIDRQAIIVSNESRMLILLQAKINTTLDTQKVAQYEHELAMQVAKRVVDAYIAKESSANATQNTLLDSANTSLGAQTEFKEATANAEAAQDQYREWLDGAADASDVIPELEGIAAEAKEAFDKAKNDTAVDTEILSNRSNDLQAAVEELNRLNDELVDLQKQLDQELGISLAQSTGSSGQAEDEEPTDKVQDLAKQEANLTQQVHDQALIVANLTDEVTELKRVLRNDTLTQHKTGQEYADAVADLENARRDLEETNRILAELRGRQANASNTAAKATFRYQIAAGQLAFGNKTFEGDIDALLALRRAVQNATDAELQAQLECAKANVTLATFSELLASQTSRLQEEMRKLNLLNDELLDVQSSLHHEGGKSGASPRLPWNLLTFLSMAVTLVIRLETA